MELKMLKLATWWMKSWSRFAAAGLMIVFFLSSAHAAEFSGADAERARDVVEMQLKAFAADDQEAAFSFAAPLIRNSFGTADAFMDMVRKGYQPVYRNSSHSFEDSFIDEIGRPSLRVRLGMQDGAQYDAVYTMELQPDGSFKISGCVILPVKDVGA
jgi:Domain of unknown function (DUF4864)